MPSAIWSPGFSSRVSHQATPTAIADVTATRAQRIASLDAWNSPSEMPWFSGVPERKIGRNLDDLRVAQVQRPKARSTW
jgi:hypothetical protein